ncbi:uncharacterized protein PHACADRAFT_263332 [Phanerochaete carnosa HHB-10118-sp]|uniref:Uncharacterized protein n=1 Tax=Phanerochaete carnosa (strain HHB-10118-sp) TaxID=650164 RepID=K5VXJ5_PHACS|nr:uncharacterized protein PHACADRAFT_263332 [Phanerochaete carnosa HHB-10118-sp]EKM51294.1 hypothetical protein PHACADRAFT_263332 [Phanerochaete carnosa HHB-10118-sp]
MIFGLGFISLAVAAVSAAPAALSARQSTVGPQCAGLGPGVFDVAYNFTLTAWNATISTNDTGVPLVLGQAGAVDGAEFKVFSTWASYPFNDFPLLTLLHGGLFGNGTYGNVAQASQVEAGDPPSFIIPPQNPTPQIYCGVADTDPAHGGYPQLAVDGDTDSFSLCPTSGSQVNIIYKSTPNNYGQYIYDECYDVKLLMLGLD